MNKKLFLLVLSLTVLSVRALPTCPEAFSSDPIRQLTQQIQIISSNKKQALENLPFVSCGENCLVLNSNTFISFQIVRDLHLSAPEITLSSNLKTLRLPSWSYLEDKALLKSWLIGHEIHPQTSPSDFIQYTKAQAIAFRAVEGAFKEGVSSFLHISPTGTGKTLVLARALNLNLTEGLHLVTAHQIHLVDQLYEAVQNELEGREISIINWNDKPNKSFVSELEQALSLKKPIVFVVTTQTLKRQLHLLATKHPKLYRKLTRNTKGIYLDEAHHLGAFHTKAALLKFKEQSGAFLYGTTATPAHHQINLRELFEREHWSYLNGEEDLFRSHPPGKVLDQLSLAIRAGELTPFEDLYIIGAFNFNETKEKPLFIQGESDFYVLNPYHYNRLAGFLHPVIQSNQKGFIVTASIAEADRLTVFLNEVFKGVEFEAYHSGLTREERQGVLSRSEEKKAHYIVAVRALDEGVNLPHLSAYIDLNANVSVKQMVHRIGRVLRLYPGKVSSDILFLSDYRDVEKAGDLLNLLDIMEMSLSFSGRIRIRQASGDARFRSGEIESLSRQQLLELREELEASVRRFWSQKAKPSLEEVIEILKRKDIRTQTEYWEQRKTDPELQNLPYHLRRSYGLKWSEIQKRMGLTVKITEENKPSLEEVIEILKRKGIRTEPEYKERRKTDPELQNLPSNLSQSYGLKWSEIKRRMGLTVAQQITQSNKPPLEEVIEILKRKGIRTETEYKERRKTDPELQNLPGNLRQSYGLKWSEIKSRIEVSP